METAAALAAAPTPLSHASLVIGRSLLGRKSTRVSCSFGSALSSSRRGLIQGYPRRPCELNGESDMRFGLCTLQQRRPLSIRGTRSSSRDKWDVKLEEIAEELHEQAEESKAAYNEAVDALKEETVKVKESNKGSYEESAEKAIEVFRDTTEKLKEEAEKARARLTATAIETAELGKSNLNLLAESGPDPIKEIAATAVNAHLKENTRQGSKIHDFCLGIPYGALLVAGGLLWFIISGSTSAIRFAVILGGILLALSVTSLRMWKESKSSIPYIQGQAAIAFILFVKHAQTFSKTGTFFPAAISAFVSAAMLGFYAYVYLSGGNPPKKEKVAEPEPASAP